MTAILEPASKPGLEYRDWDPRYPLVVQKLVTALSPLPSYLSIEHVGSTAVPGCGGKGTIDLLGLYHAGFLSNAKAHLWGVGFCHQGPEFSNPWPEARPMYLGTYRCRDGTFLIYIHILEETADEVRRFRAFRDRLKLHPELVEEYCKIKRAIIAEGATDTDDYRVRKRPFMQAVLGPEHELQ